MTNIDLNEWVSQIDPARFWELVKRGTADECWEWQGTVNAGKMPYGRFYLSKTKPCRAHRFAYVLAKGQIPGNLMVCHSCDNPRCCNPSHLWLGTNKDNMDDRSAKKRHYGSKSSCSHARKFLKFGAAHVQATLTPDMVREIRSSPLRNYELAAKFGVSKGVISRCRKGLTYPEWSLEKPTLERPHNEAAIAEAVSSGTSLLAAAKQFDVSVSTVKRACKRQGVKPNGSIVSAVLAEEEQEKAHA